MSSDPKHDPAQAHDVLAADAFPVGDATPELGEAPRDILAAEEFPLGDADPELHDEPAHDVLAAEEFPLGDADPELEREQEAHDHGHDHHDHDHHDHDHSHGHDHDDGNATYIDLPVVGGIVAAVAGVGVAVWRLRRRRVAKTRAQQVAEAATAAAQHLPERVGDAAEQVHQAAGRVTGGLRKRLKR